MAISIPSAPVRAIVTGNTNHAVALTGVQAGDTIEFFFVDRTGGAVINSISDTDTGTYTQRSTLSQATFLTRVWVRENVSAPAGGNLTVTAVTNASQNSQCVARIVRSDAGGGVFATFDQAAAAVDGPAASTSAVSNTVAASAAGILSGSLSTGNSQGSTPTVGDHASLTGETVSPAGGAGVRSFAVYGVNAASGTLGFTSAASADVAIASSSYAFHLINYIESGGAVAGRSRIIGGKLVGGILVRAS